LEHYTIVKRTYRMNTAWDLDGMTLNPSWRIVAIHIIAYPYQVSMTCGDFVNKVQLTAHLS
jgi:hypothetical protein